MSDERRAGPKELIDVDRLVGDLQMRAERDRAVSSESRLPTEPFAERDLVPSSGVLTQPPEPSRRRLELRPELVASNRPVIGPVIAWVKRLMLKLMFRALETWFREEAETREAAIRAEAAARERAEAGIRELAKRVQASTSLDMEGRLGALETMLDQLELVQRVAANEIREHVDRIERERVDLLYTKFDHLQLPVRLARLERQLVAPEPLGTRTRNRPKPSDGAPRIDYLTFEARFRPDETVKERQSIYVDPLRGCRRVADLGCGRGELLELLLEAGVSAYGVDIDRDFVAVAREKGLEIVEDDAVRHVEQLDPGAVDAITASHLIEHLPSEALVRLIGAALERLDEGGVLILETPNPESIVAGSVNFHRDPTHVRPIHPDTLEFLCETAGFRDVTVRRLSRTPKSELLPQTNSRANPLAAHLDTVVDRLNDLIYGYQDYAVLAWK